VFNTSDPDIKKIQEYREETLVAIYDLAGGSRRKAVLLTELVRHINFNKDLLRDIIDFLIDEKLITTQDVETQDEAFRLTHEGIKIAEEIKTKEPEKKPEYRIRRL
jgi:predicted transcriptional regulator